VGADAFIARVKGRLSGPASLPVPSFIPTNPLKFRNGRTPGNKQHRYSISSSTTVENAGRECQRLSRAGHSGIESVFANWRPLRGLEACRFPCLPNRQPKDPGRPDRLVQSRRSKNLRPQRIAKTITAGGEPVTRMQPGDPTLLERGRGLPPAAGSGAASSRPSDCLGPSSRLFLERPPSMPVWWPHGCRPRSCGARDRTLESRAPQYSPPASAPAQPAPVPCRPVHDVISGPGESRVQSR